MVKKIKLMGINSDSTPTENRAILNPAKNEIVQADSKIVVESRYVLKVNPHNTRVAYELNRFGIPQVVIVLD